MSKSFLAKSLICSGVALVTVGATVGSASAQYKTHDFGFLADLPTIESQEWQGKKYHQDERDQTPFSVSSTSIIRRGSRVTATQVGG